VCRRSWNTTDVGMPAAFRIGYQTFRSQFEHRRYGIVASAICVRQHYLVSNTTTMIVTTTTEPIVGGGVKIADLLYVTLSGDPAELLTSPRRSCTAFGLASYSAAWDIAMSNWSTVSLPNRAVAVSIATKPNAIADNAIDSGPRAARAAVAAGPGLESAPCDTVAGDPSRLTSLAARRGIACNPTSDRSSCRIAFCPTPSAATVAATWAKSLVSFSTPESLSEAGHSETAYDTAWFLCYNCEIRKIASPHDTWRLSPNLLG
jgi:hypothetical protein